MEEGTVSLRNSTFGRSFENPEYDCGRELNQINLRDCYPKNTLGYKDEDSPQVQVYDFSTPQTAVVYG
jgi:hypothetical protein